MRSYYLAPPPPSLPLVRSTGYTQEARERETTGWWDWWGEWGAKSKSYDRRKAWSSINHSILSGVSKCISASSYLTNPPPLPVLTPSSSYAQLTLLYKENPRGRQERSSCTLGWLVYVDSHNGLLCTKRKLSQRPHKAVKGGDGASDI